MTLATMPRRPAGKCRGIEGYTRYSERERTLGQDRHPDYRRRRGKPVGLAPIAGFGRLASPGCAGRQPGPGGTFQRRMVPGDREHRDDRADKPGVPDAAGIGAGARGRGRQCPRARALRGARIGGRGSASGLRAGTIALRPEAIPIPRSAGKGERSADGSGRAGQSDSPRAPRFQLCPSASARKGARAANPATPLPSATPTCSPSATSTS